jgi:hypothetical protein
MMHSMRTTPIAICATLILGVSATAAMAQGDEQPVAPVDEYTEQTGPTPMAAGASRKQRRGSKPKGRMVRPTPGGKGKLEIGFGDTGFTHSDSGVRNTLFNEAAAANARAVRLYVRWRRVAPSNPTPAFDATNPGSPEYNFAALDGAVKTAKQRGMRVVLLVSEAPSWAEGDDRPSSNVIAGTWKPNPADVADFGTALARRYSGNFAGLPRVRDYILWNEPNLVTNLAPIWKGKNGKQPASPFHYRKMLNRFYDAVRRVGGKNRVVAGGTAPYGADPGVMNMRPLLFWRKLLCVRSNGKAQKKCNKPKFDVAAHHPINTSGGPRRSAIHPDDVSTPDLRHLVDVLRTAEKAGNVKPKGKKRQVWATELWWESNPPDPAGVPLQRHAAYYSEALYLLWKQGASMVLPYQVRDDAYDGNPGRSSWESGAYFVDGEAKPAKRAIEFPFVAERKNKRKVTLWGIAPKGGKVTVKSGKRTIEKIKAKRSKIFTANVRLKKRKGKHKLQAEIGKNKSLVWKQK